MCDFSPPAAEASRTLAADVSGTLAGDYRIWHTGARRESRPDSMLGRELTRREVNERSVDHAIVLRAETRW